MNNTTVLLVGHGSRHPEGNQEIGRFAEMWRARQTDWRIDVCFIEHADLLLDEGLDRAANNAQRVLVVPFVLNAAGHVKMEIPQAVEEARARHPKVQFASVRHLGMGYEVLEILQKKLKHALDSLDSPDPLTTGIILLGRGSSDAGANGEMAKMARWLFEDSDHDLVDIAFTGITWPRLETVVQRQARIGMMQMVVLPVYLFTGLLTERIKRQVARLEKQYPQISFALGEHFGFDEGVFDLLDARIANLGAEESSLLECDGCKYRLLAAEFEHEHEHEHHAH